MAELKIFENAEKADKTDSASSAKGGKFTKLKKLFKNKPFLIAFCLVAVAGLYSLLRKSTQPAATNSEAGTYSNTDDSLLYGYGYSGMTDNTYDDTHSVYNQDLFDTLLESFDTSYGDLSAAYDEKISNIQSAYEDDTAQLRENISFLDEKITESESNLNAATSYISMLNDIDQMKANSDAYHFAQTAEQRSGLHAANVAIANKYGWSFDDDSGLWVDEKNNPVYVTTTQKSVNSGVQLIPGKSSSGGSSGGSSGNSGKTESAYDKGIKQMMANSDAYLTAKTQAEKDSLRAQNQSIGASLGLTFNSDAGTWHDSSGNRVYMTEAQKAAAGK